MSLPQPQNNRKQDGYPAENALQKGFSAGFFQNIKATRPRKARTQDTMPLTLGHASPCYPHIIAILRCCPYYHIVERFAPFNVTK
ncbi:hypothetical protein [Prevotella sp. HJM029]|uniref:hypothetical protein n=1 Tax=Prevotella sp. HJM029 TaxID=1433844 RepID=UPI00048C22A8|nr:hypothetical protein [Prevotella sp. HJM029]